MLNSVQDAQQVGKENFDKAAKSLVACANVIQIFAADTADYARRSFEASVATLEKLMGAKTLDRAIEIQSDHMRVAYEQLVAQTTRAGEVVTNVAKESYKPLEGLLAKGGRR